MGSTGPYLRPDEADLAWAMTHVVPVVSRKTAVEHFALTRRRESLLVASGIFRRVRVPGEGFLMQDVSQPLCAWQPGEPPLDPHKLAHANDKRFDDARSEKCFFVATRKLVKRYGGRIPGEAISRPEQYGHHAVTFEIFCRHFRGDDRYVSEFHVPPTVTGVKRPDAYLLSRDKRPICAIETAGSSYDYRAFLSLVRFCEEHALAITIY